MFANLARLCLRVLLPVTLVGAVACGNDPASVTATGTASFAAISDFIAEAVGGVTTIDEGDTGNFTISRLCNPVSALSHTVTWNYGDPTTTSDTLVGTASTGAVAGSGCGADYPVDFATQLITLGSGDLQSPSYTYADDGSYNVTAQANDGSGDSTKTIAMTVNNVLPVTTLTGPSGVTREGDSYNFAGTVADPGTTATEISYVVWDFGDLTVNAYDCATDFATEALCTTTRARTRGHVFADDGSYTVRLRVCDDSRTTAPGSVWTSTPAGCSDDQVTVTIDNRVPALSSITSNAPSNIIAEGSVIGFTGAYTDQGADTHAIVWSYGDGSTNDTGTAETQTATPNPSTLVPADILTPSHRYCNANGGTQLSQTVTMRVDDDNGGWGTQTLLVLVNDVSPTVALTPSATTIDEGGNVTFTVSAGSGSAGAAGCDDLTAAPYTWSCGTNAVEVSGCGSSDTTCVCKYPDGTATYTASVKVDDEDSSTTKTQDITVNNVNPVADAGPPQTIDEGDSVTFAGDATDVGSPETLTYTWTLPGPIVIGVGTSPDYVFQEHGTYTVTLTVTDGDGGTHADTVVITVNDVDPQNVLVTGPGTYVEGTSYTFTTTATTGATPNDVDALTTYDIDWGDSTSTTGIAYGTTATHTYADDDSYTITSTVHDEDSTAADTLVITVANVAPSAANATADDTTPEEGALVTFGGSFVDPSSADTFDIEWDFDDGSPVATATVGAGVRTIPAATHAFMEQGTYVVQVTVTDDDGDSTTDTITVTVSDISPDTTGTVLARAGNEGSPVAFTFTASSLYPAADAIGDGAGALTPPYQFDCDNNGSYETTSATVSANCTFAQDGSYSVPARVCDEDSCSTVTFTATISNVLPVLTLPANPAAFPEGDLAGFVFTGASFVDPGADTWFASWTFTDPDTGSVITHTPTVQPTVAGAIAGTVAYVFQDDESSGLCGGAACGPSETPYRRVCAVLTITDDDGSVSTPSTVGGGCYQLRIENVDPALAAPLQVTVPNPIVGEGTAVSFIVNASDVGDADNELTYTFDWDDGSSNTVLVGQDSTSHMFPTAGTYTVQITVTDDDGGFVQATDIEIEVVNVPPNIIAVLETGPKPENSSIAVSVVLESFTVGDLTYTYDWGDGSPVDIQDELTGGSVATHVYPQDGTYTVTVTVTDDVGDFDTVTTPVVITNVAPVVSVQTPSPINEGLGVTLSVTATDASPSDGRTFQVDWNGSGSFTTITPGGTAPNFTLSSGAFTYADNGIFVAKVRVSDDDTFTEVASPIIVNNRNPTLSSFLQTGAAATEGTLPVNVTATATDVATDALSYFFDFGDGMSATDSDGTVSHVYRQDGTYTISVRVTDDDGGVTTSTLNATVANIAPVLSSVDVPSSATAGSAISATIFASDPGADVLEYAWRFGGTPGVWQFTSTSSNTRSFTFDSAGTYDVELGVRDSATASWVTTLRTISVTTPGTSLTVRATGPINEGSSTTLTVTPAGTGPYLVDIDWQDDGSYDEQLSDPGNTTLTFTTTHAYLDNGQYRIRTRVTDQGAGGGVATTVVTVAVDNVAPTLLPATVTQTTASEGVAYTAPAFSVVDPAGGNDAPVYSLASAPVGMTINPGTGAISWVPGYAAAVAPNGVVVEVSDGDGGMDSVAWLITVTPVDADSDGLPDNWEIANLGGTGQDGSGDDDGDGISNHDEFLNGTDPQVSNAPGVATLLAPVDMLVGTATPTLVVNNAVDPDDDALTYTFEIFDTDAVATATPVVVESGVAGGSGTTSWTVASALSEGATYWWRVTANDGVVDGPATEAAWFTVSTVNDPPAAPALVYPVASGVVDSAQPYLEATMVMDPDGDAVTYGFAVYSDSAMTTLVTSVVGRPLPFWVVDVALEHGTQYWWRASATDGFSAPVMSTSSTFTVDLPVSNVAPSAPTVVSPDDVTVTTTTPTLSVQNATDDDGDALSYFFEVASNAGFTGASLQVSAELAEGTTTTDFVVATALQEDRTYYWRARAYDGIVTGEWAVGTFFVNSANNAPGVPRPLSPSNAALLSMAPMELTIANVMDPEGSAVTYTFQLMADAAASTVLETGTNVASGAGSTTSWAFTTAITPGTVYYWRARASDGAAQSAYSSVYSFSVYDQAAVEAAIAAAAQAAADANAAAAAANADADAAAAAAAAANADADAAQADADAAAAAAANADADAAAAQADADAAQATAEGAVAASDAAAKDAKSAIKTAKNAGCSGTGDTSLWMLLVLAPLGLLRRRRRA